ncbi:MAG: diguanylate cyclase (GGDEF)-like protein [Halioglobus sp.]|jgi:diguanylate cyclase (GGDEF)-like protein
MNIAVKITLAFVVTAVLLISSVSLYVAQREYRAQLEQSVARAEANVASRPDLPFLIYKDNQAALVKALKAWSEAVEINFAIAYNSSSEPLANSERSTKSSAGLPKLQTIRRGVSIAERSLNSLRADESDIAIGFWSSAFNRDTTIHLTLPIFSSLDPTQAKLQASDFYRAIAQPDTRGSLVVIGYVHQGIAREALFDYAYHAAFKLFWLSLILVLLGAAVIILITKRFTAPISQLAQLARDAADGKLDTAAKINGGPEFKEIERVLHDLLGDGAKKTQALELDRQLLALKAAENASTLSKRNEELDKATEQISHTKSQLRKLAFYDSVTTLPNRRMFTEQLALLLRLNQRNTSTLGLVLINLNNFKRVNDTLGHSAGDLLLQKAGKRLNQCLRESDLLARDDESGLNIGVSRLGGDEFAVVLNQLGGANAASSVVKRLIKALIKPIDINGQEVVISASVGVAIAPDHGVDVESVEKAASIALHHARTSIEEPFVFYHPDMESNTADHLKLESDLRKAVERDELVLHYQPQVDTVSGSVVSAEALLRWQHPEHGIVAPHEFIAMAEELGLISEFDDWVLSEACRQTKAFQTAGIKLPRVAVNVSPTHFNQAFVAKIAIALQQNDLPAASLELGLPEAIFSDATENVSDCLEQLKELGVYLSVDDFGTGYAPINYLTCHDLDEIKISRRFVAQCDSSEESGKLIIAIIAIAKSLNLNLVAEGVETEAQQHFLRKQGAKIMRGYLFSPAVPADELKPLLVPWHFMEQSHQITR